MKSEKDKERYRRWRAENQDKVREQRKRRWARKTGLLPAYVAPEPLSAEETQARHIERMKKHHQRRKERMASDPEYAKRIREQELARHRRRYDQLKADPVAYQAKLDAERNRRRVKKGIPLDAPVMGNRLTAEQRAERKAEKERLKAERAAARPPKMTLEERKARRRVWQKEYDKKKRDLARARRAAEVAEAMARYPSSQSPKIIVNDPPELAALFKKASKGERPFERFTGKKMGAFTARAKWI
jgi:hypothetical protein